MGTDALLSSGVTEKMLYLVRDRRAISPSDPLNQVRKSRIVLFTLVELLGFGATFAITQVSHPEKGFGGEWGRLIEGRLSLR
jgi:hypothetical protein